MSAKPKQQPAPDQPKPRLVRMSTSAAQQASDFLRDKGDDAYALKGIGTDRDMTALERLKAVRLSRLNMKRSGIYGQLVDTMVNFVVGDGVMPKYEDSDVQAYLDEVLEHPINDFQRSQRARFTTTLVDGEYLLGITIPTREVTSPGVPINLSRMPMLGRMDSDAIEEVEVAAVNQDCVMRVSVDPGMGKPKVTYPVARPGVEPRDNGDGTATAVLLWRVNALKRRGLPWFSRVLDKAHMLDGVVDELARKAKYTSRFWLHGTYEDQSDPKKNKAIERKLLAWLRSWNPGEALASTKGVEVNCFAPDLKLQDQKALYDLIVDYILGSHGIPRHWFSSGDGTNRATSVEQGTPIFRAIDAAQSGYVADCEALFAYIIWIGKQNGAIPKDASEKGSAVPSDVATRDSIRDTKEVNDLMAALDMAVANGTLWRSEAQKIGRRLFASKGWGDDLDMDNPPPLPEEGAGAPGLGALPGEDGADGAAGQGATVPGTEGATGLGAAPGAPGDGVVQDTALNGAQVSSMLLVVQGVSDGTLPAEAAKAMLLSSFPSVPEALITRMVEAADAFEPPQTTEPDPTKVVGAKPPKPPTPTLKE